MTDPPYRPLIFEKIPLIYGQLSNLLIREKGKQESGILVQMLELLKLGRESGIIAENATFDSWFYVPWFLKAVLELGFCRVVTKPKENFNYTYQGEIYKLAVTQNSHMTTKEHPPRGTGSFWFILPVPLGGWERAGMPVCPLLLCVTFAVLR